MNALFSLAPTVLIGLVFWFIMWAVIRSDRSERDARAKIEAEERLKAGRVADEVGVSRPPTS